MTPRGLCYGKGGHEAQDPQTRDEPVTRDSAGDIFTHAIILSHLLRPNPSAPSWPRKRMTATNGQGLYRLDDCPTWRKPNFSRLFLKFVVVAAEMDSQDLPIKQAQSAGRLIIRGIRAACALCGNAVGELQPRGGKVGTQLQSRVPTALHLAACLSARDCMPVAKIQAPYKLIAPVRIR